jgi:mono/diheme cytochrome c family protein
MAATALGAVTACGNGGDAPDRDASAPAGSLPGAASAPATALDAVDLPQGVTVQMVQQGQQIYSGQGLCYSCHGPTGEGTVLAPNQTDGDWLWITPGDDEYAQIVNIITTGVPEPKEFPAPMLPMGGAQLTDDQIRSVAAYIYSISRG